MRKHCDECGTPLMGRDPVRCRACRRLALVELSLAGEDVAAPTLHRPGSLQKMVVLGMRLRAGLPLHSPGEGVEDIPD